MKEIQKKFYEVIMVFAMTFACAPGELNVNLSYSAFNIFSVEDTKFGSPSIKVVY